MRKRWLTLAAIAAVTVLIASLGAAVRGGSASAAHKAGFSACLVTDIGGLNDKSFNHLAYVGLQHAQRAGIKGRVIQSHSPADYIPNLKACVQSGAGITIGVGFLMTDAMDAIASAYPSNKFAIVDVDVTSMKHKPKNVEGLLFREQEAGYLVGYAAGLYAKANGGKAVGSVGGLKIPPVDRYIAGFQFGAKKADPGIKTLNGYSNDFVKQNKCKESRAEPDRAGLGRRVPGRGPVRPRRPRRGTREEHLRCRCRRRSGLPRLVGHDERAQARRRRGVQRHPGGQPRQARGRHQQAVQRLDRRRRVRQVELEGPRRRSRTRWPRSTRSSRPARSRAFRATVK